MIKKHRKTRGEGSFDRGSARLADRSARDSGGVGGTGKGIHTHKSLKNKKIFGTDRYGLGGLCRVIRKMQKRNGVVGSPFEEMVKAERLRQGLFAERKDLDISNP